MLKSLLSKLLRNIADDLDSGSYQSSDDEVHAVMGQLADFNSDMPLSKAQACDYLNISRSTFDKLVKEGKLPKGKKRMGFKELSWRKEELWKD